MSSNLFESSYRRHAVVESSRPCEVPGCERLADGDERRLHTSRTRVGLDQWVLHFYCSQHAQNAREEFEIAEDVVAERAEDRHTSYWLDGVERRGFPEGFDFNTCGDADHARRWEMYQQMLAPFVEWLPEPCFRVDCARLAETQAPQLCVAFEYSDWDRVQRWYCTPHARTASRHANEAEVALVEYNAAFDALGIGNDGEALTEACTALLERTRAFIRD